ALLLHPVRERTPCPAPPRTLASAATQVSVLFHAFSSSAVRKRRRDAHGGRPHGPVRSAPRRAARLPARGRRARRPRGVLGGDAVPGAAGLAAAHRARAGA